MLDNPREKEILPLGPEDLTIPSRIAKLDEHRKFLIDQKEALVREIAELDTNRSLLLGRAKEVRVFEDEAYKIVEVPIFPKKTVDVETLKRLAPEKHEMIVRNLTAKAEDEIKARFAKIAVFIAQADVKAVIKDKGLLAQIIPEPTVPTGWEYSIVKK